MVRSFYPLAFFFLLSWAFGSIAGVVSGTGFFVSPDGLIATNNHVVDGAEEIFVRVGGHDVRRASVVLRDAANDIAVLKVSGGSYPSLPIRSSSAAKKGMAVFTIGFPNSSIQGREAKVTDGVISSLSGIGGEPNSFQISVPIQPGNSGGPLIDMTGAVLGITTAKLSSAAMIRRGGSAPENVNYALKSNYLLELIGTDAQLAKSVARATSQKIQPLTVLVERAEQAVVFVTASTVSSREADRGSGAQVKPSNLSREAEAIEDFRLGKAAYVKADYKNALERFGRAAAIGNAEAQFYIALMFKNGFGVGKNDQEGNGWSRKAAEQGNADAQNLLGTAYAKGQGVAVDDEEAFKWFRKAAEQGHTGGQANLGIMYAGARGTAKDETEAVRWFRAAADRGNANAQYNLGAAFETGRGVGKDADEAVRWYRRSAEQGNPSAQTRLGYMYSKGLGLAQDFIQAVAWYRKAVAQGFAPAQASLGMMYADGLGLAADDTEALRLFRLAADQENAIGQANLGLMYATGRVVEKDEAEAARWFRKAADQGNTFAKAKLEALHRN